MFRSLSSSTTELKSTKRYGGETKSSFRLKESSDPRVSAIQNAHAETRNLLIFSEFKVTKPIASCGGVMLVSIEPGPINGHTRQGRVAIKTA